MKRRKKPEIEPEGFLVGYARVSTEDQNLSLQTEALKRAGVRDDNLHVEKLSATAKKRPALDLAIKDLRAGDTFVVWRLDRLARSMRDLYARLDQIVAKGASFRSLTEHFDISTAMGQLYIAIAGAFAQFERQIISYRTAAGIKSWKERTGGKWGPPRVMTEEKIREVGRRLKSGDSGPKVAADMGISTASVYGFWKRVKTKRGHKWVRKADKD